MASIITADTGAVSGTAGLKQSADSSGILALATGTGTTAVTIDASQQVGVGVVPSAWSGKAVQINTTGYLAAVGSTDVQIGANSYFTGSAWKYIAAGAATNYYQDSGIHNWRYAVSGSAGGTITWVDAMRIDASGNVLIGGATSTVQTGCSYIVGGAASGAIGMLNLRNRQSTAGKYSLVGPTNDADPYFVIYNQSSVGVYLAPGGTSWTAGSDETTKDIIEPITNAAEKVSTLRAVIGKYKKDDEGTRRSFLIAQDVQAVLPEAVSNAPDGTLGLQYTDVIPLLVAAIQEQQAIITTLTERISALEAK